MKLTYHINQSRQYPYWWRNFGAGFDNKVYKKAGIYTSWYIYLFYRNWLKWFIYYTIRAFYQNRVNPICAFFRKK